MRKKISLILILFTLSMCIMYGCNNQTSQSSASSNSVSAGSLSASEDSLISGNKISLSDAIIIESSESDNNAAGDSASDNNVVENSSLDSSESESIVSDNSASENSVSDNSASNMLNDTVFQVEMISSNIDSSYEEKYSDDVISLVNDICKNAEYVKSMKTSFSPTAIEGKIFDGYSRDIFFANGTAIYIKDPDYDVSQYIHDTVLQEALGNGLSPDNPGYGAVIFWHEGRSNKYVYVSNMAMIFGGSYNSDLKSDVSINIVGSSKTAAYPNVSFVFGGGMNGSVLGNIDISVCDGRPAFLYGGGFNGTVFGNINIDCKGDSRSTDIIGGGLAMSYTVNKIAIVSGNINMSICTEKREDAVDCIAGGGVAIAAGKCKALADVTGSIYVEVSGYNLYELCGGGLASTSEGSPGMAIACVYGDTKVNFSNGKMRMEWKSKYNKKGIITAEGLANDGVALVYGNKELITEDVYIDRAVYGVSENVINLNENAYDCSIVTRAYNEIAKCENADYSVKTDYEPGRSRTTKTLYDERNKVTARMQLRRENDDITVWVYDRELKDYIVYSVSEIDSSVLQRANITDTINKYNNYLENTNSSDLLTYVQKNIRVASEDEKLPLFIKAYIPNPEAEYIYIE